MNNNIKALYIHIPFCDHICIYCDFYKMISSYEKRKKYISYLIKELDFKKDLLKNIKTIYIGGGTPSSLELDLLEVLFKKISSLIKIENVIEYTIEANVKDIIKYDTKYDNSSNSFLNLLQKYNLNRISLGIQSFNDEKLIFLNRNNTRLEALNSIKLLQKYNFLISCDLIYGVSYLDEEIIKDDLDILIENNISHISTYSIILEEYTYLYKLYKENKFKPVDDEFDYKLYEYIKKRLSNYNHYEISNFCLEGYQSIHNLTYWNNDYYIGVGANSSYYYNQTRFTNINNLEKYYQGIDNNKLIYKEEIKLSKIDCMNEEIMLGLRKLKGISILDFFKKYNLDIYEVYPNLVKLIKTSVLECINNYIKIKEDYIYLQNKIVLDIIGECL